MVLSDGCLYGLPSALPRHLHHFNALDRLARRARLHLLDETLHVLCRRLPGISSGSALARTDDDIDEREVDLVPSMTQGRREQFATGRRAGMAALARAGCADVSVAVDVSGAPRFPTGFIGAIAHELDHAICVVAHSNEFDALGVALELVNDHELDLEEIATSVELERVESLSAEWPACATAILVAAKESARNALSTETGRPIALLDVNVGFDAELEEFRATLVTGNRVSIAGMFTVTRRGVVAVAYRRRAQRGI